MQPFNATMSAPMPDLEALEGSITAHQSHVVDSRLYEHIKTILLKAEVSPLHYTTVTSCIYYRWYTALRLKQYRVPQQTTAQALGSGVKMQGLRCEKSLCSCWGMVHQSPLHIHTHSNQ